MSVVVILVSGVVFAFAAIGALSTDYRRGDMRE